MATPTPRHGGPVAATPPVSTPFSSSHPAFSPHGLKSVVPSPQQFKKSPANSNLLFGNSATTSFSPMNFDSPSTAAALGIIPGIDIPLDTQSLGLGIGLTAKGEEDEKKKKLQLVLDILKVNKGRVSEEGIERLARRVGMECLWEDGMGSGLGTRTLIIAGNALSVDIECTNNIVGKVTVAFPESSETVQRHSNDVSAILLKDLQLSPTESPLTKMLNRFALNLERLAALDQLSVVPQLNCHEAIAGIFESLERLHEWELERLKEDNEIKDKSPYNLTKIALCRKSGRPIVNARDNVGLNIDYWQERSDVAANSANSKPQEASNEPQIWSLIVECAKLTGHDFPPVRVTDKWIAPNIRKANPTSDELLMAVEDLVLDWQTPADILLPISAVSKADGAMEGVEQEISRSPEVKFVVKFNPPLVVPFVVANQIYSATGATLEHSLLTTYDSLLVPQEPHEPHERDTSHRRLQRRKAVLVRQANGDQFSVVHTNSLTVQKLEYGRLLTELPFSHPKQLVDLLPLFRQYARLSSLLNRSFGSHTSEVPSSEGVDQSVAGLDEFVSFMSDSKSSSAVKTDGKAEKQGSIIDISLLMQPHPQLRLTSVVESGIVDITMDVAMNGTIKITAENILERLNDKISARGGGKSITREALGRIVEVAEDLGVFVEFIKGKLG